MRLGETHGTEHFKQIKGKRQKTWGGTLSVTRFDPTMLLLFFFFFSSKPRMENMYIFSLESSFNNARGTGVAIVCSRKETVVVLIARLGKPIPYS